MSAWHETGQAECGLSRFMLLKQSLEAHGGHAYWVGHGL